MAYDTLALGQHLNSDRFAVRGAVTAIRNAYMLANQQQLLAIGPAERRASARVRVHVPVRISAAIFDASESLLQPADGPVVEGECRDISLGGMGLIHHAPLPGRCLIVRFDLPEEGPICLAAEQVWSNPTGDGMWGSGVKILGLSDRETAYV